MTRAVVQSEWRDRSRVLRRGEEQGTRPRGVPLRTKLSRKGGTRLRLGQIRDIRVKFDQGQASRERQPCAILEFACSHPSDNSPSSGRYALSIASIYLP